uniref:Uncharacterized protein n=1 Tax=Arundo donax TaxID=35708 RepID=A0A0A9CAI7_ARUDO
MSEFIAAAWSLYSSLLRSDRRQRAAA